MRYYAGIGSRETPVLLLKKMKSIAAMLRTMDYKLRSGGAPGADTAFAHGAATQAEIYLPWPHFNRINRWTNFNRFWAEEIAMKFHPSWDGLEPAARKLMARNTCQVLGPGPDAPHSDFVVCWTMNGEASGGTGQALRIADAYMIPVFNLFYKDAESDLIKFAKENA